MKNNERVIVQIIKEICQDEGIELVSFSYDWILRLKKDNHLGFVVGYNFGLNNSTSARICDDKCAASDILTYSNIPAVEHIFFMSTENLYYIGESGNWNRILNLFNKHKTLVCKANEGTGGKAVFLVKNQTELESAVHNIFKQNGNMAICPYYDILKEYRVIIINNEVKLIYAKNIPYVVGNAEKNLRQLILEYMAINQIIFNIELEDEILENVLNEGEVWNINWKSNLGQGAKPEIIMDNKLFNKLSQLAIQAATALSVNFASIDIVDTSDGMRILEVNSGIMMENFIHFASENYIIAKEIYREAIFSMMEMDYINNKVK